MSEYIESDMDFLPLFNEGNSFYVERSQLLSKLGDGVKSVEFMALMPGRKLYFIEAKSSAPNPDNKDDFCKYCVEMLEKVQHSIDLFASKELEVNKDFEEEIPECFNEKFIDYRLFFLLIIKKYREEWCSDVLDGLQRKLIALRKIWKIEIVVWTGEKARKMKLIV